MSMTLARVCDDAAEILRTEQIAFLPNFPTPQISPTGISFHVYEEHCFFCGFFTAVVGLAMWLSGSDDWGGVVVRR